MGTFHSVKLLRLHRHYKYGEHLLEVFIEARNSKLKTHQQMIQKTISLQPNPVSPKNHLPKFTSASGGRRCFVGSVAKFLDSFFNNYS
ncbi:hypothetical protein evm_001979 [Chilo suppressalis]|nr:hypothetical protein evm_001979 [Chilo suppressalis]